MAITGALLLFGALVLIALGSQHTRSALDMLAKQSVFSPDPLWFAAVRLGTGNFNLGLGIGIGIAGLILLLLPLGLAALDRSAKH
jgi:hypothetical protein